MAPDSILAACQGGRARTGWLAGRATAGLLRGLHHTRSASRCRQWDGVACIAANHQNYSCGRICGYARSASNYCSVRLADSGNAAAG
jgi:hypothetical protein